LRRTIPIGALALAACAHVIATVDASDPNRVKMGCLRFAVPNGCEIRDTTAESVVIQPKGAAQNGDMIIVDSEGNDGKRLEEWVNAITNAGTLPASLFYHELSHHGERAWLAESKETPLAYFAIEGGGRFFHIRKMRGDRACFERLWKSVELEGCS
jgi:hypothetical protein